MTARVLWLFCDNGYKLPVEEKMKKRLVGVSWGVACPMRKSLLVSREVVVVWMRFS